MNSTEATLSSKHLWETFRHFPIEVFKYNMGITPDEFTKEEAKHWEFVIAMQEKAPPAMVQKVITDFFFKMQTECNKHIEDLVKENDLARASGVSFSKRKEIHDKIQNYQNVKKSYQKKGSLRKISEVLQPEDIPHLKKHGIKSFIEHNYERFIK